MAVADNPVVIHFNEFIIKQDFPLHMKQFPVAMCEEAVPKMVVTCNLCCEIFECIGELSFHFRRW